MTIRMTSLFCLALLLMPFVLATPAHSQNAAPKQKRQFGKSPPSKPLEARQTLPSSLASPQGAPPLQPPPAASQNRSNYFFGALYSAANQLSYSGTVNLYGVPTSLTATEKTEGAFGLVGGYILRRPSGFGYSAALAFEFARKSQGVTGTAGNVNVIGTYSGDGGTNLLTTALNGNYSLSRDFYLAAGINYPLTFATPGAQSLSGLPGYQVGVGYAFAERFTGEIFYRVVRMKGTINSAPFNLDFSEVSFPGAMLSVQYLF